VRRTRKVYAPNLLEKRVILRSSRYQATPRARRQAPLGGKPQLLRRRNGETTYRRCIFVYQGVAPRNCATTREILVHLIGACSAPERLDEARHGRGVRTGPERFRFATRTHTAGKRGWKPQAKPWSRPTRHLRGGTALPSPRTGDRRRRTRRPPSRTSSIVGLARLSPLAEGRESSPVL